MSAAIEDATEPDGRSWTTVETLRRGWRMSPELHNGAGITVFCAALGAAGRLVLPVLIQLGSR